MTTKTKLIWRLTKLPNAEELRDLVKDKILTIDEAREILFSKETEEERDAKSLEEEVKFLRDLVEKLSQNRTQIIETIREIEKPYRRHTWYGPYDVYCSTSVGNVYLANGSGTTTAYNTTTASLTSGVDPSFNGISTF